MSQKPGMGQQKAIKVSGAKKETVNKQVNWQQVSNITGYIKKNISESFLKSNLQRTVFRNSENLQNNAPQCEVAKSLNMSSSTFYNIKRLRKS